MIFHGASVTVGRKVREFRINRGWSRRHLAERCAAVGAPEINQGVITNMELKGRRVSVEQLLILALVFDVVPLALVGTARAEAIGQAGRSEALAKLERP